MFTELVVFTLLAVGARGAVDADMLREAITTFSFDLLKELVSGEARNLAFSPVGVAAALSALARGAGGNSARQLLTALHLDVSRAAEDPYGGLAKASQEAVSGSAAAVEVAGRMFLDERFQLAAGAPVEVASFGARDGGRAVNDWASRATRARVGELVDARLPADTGLVMASAAFFRSPWSKPFKTRATAVLPFATKPGRVAKTPFMQQSKYLVTGQDDRLAARWLQLPFKGEKFFMLVLLPNEKYGLREMVRKLNYSDISAMTQTYPPKLVNVQLPRFTLTSKIKLDQPLRKLGVTDVFGAEADLRAISSSPAPLWVTLAVHKAVIEVDEQGGLAAGTAGIEVKPRRTNGSETASFQANHPFLAVVFDKSSRVPFLIATVANPSHMT